MTKLYKELILSPASFLYDIFTFAGANFRRAICFSEKLDVAVARVVAETGILPEYYLPLVCASGLFVAAEGHDPQIVGSSKRVYKRWPKGLDPKALIVRGQMKMLSCLGSGATQPI
ncbi:uncharacterized protein LOC121234149 isoform X3 [Juglans microcarpa x Juglans regia]|uniref:uncharacterized protein LOC121234149 isoform X3 n=1 Tax=Juglans microcarpa x Juglans regia TaxID=2249226 RepID=UPI001B7E153F|nr:uncharacterized protein LOC121234149 isoform X3 [Juglans microcarpa x Juglans regia]